MIFSKFNFFFQHNKKCFVYNSISNAFLELDNDTYSFLNRTMINNDIIKNLEEELVQLLVQKKIIVSNDWEDVNLIKYETHLRRYDKSILNLTIAPTYACNFNCYYCYENTRPNVFMSKETEKNLIKFIKNSESEIIDITWYGGEPLLNFDVMLRVSNTIRNDLKKELTASIITNGYLLNRNVIDRLEGININKIQITIDGIGEKHNEKRTHIKGYNTFDKIIKNIKLLQKLQPSVEIAIRVNIDKNNKDAFIDVYNYFYSQFDMKNTFVAPAFIDYTTDGCNDISDCLIDTNDKLSFPFDIYKKYGLQVDSFYPSNDRYECMARNINSYVIGADGLAFKCYNDIGDSSKAVLNINNSSESNQIVEAMYMTGSDPLSDNNCLNCNLLPVCSGGCPYERFKYDYNNSTENNFCSKFKDNLKNNLIFHYENFINK